MRQEERMCQRPVAEAFRGGVCCRPVESIQAPITPSSSSYTETLASCGRPVRGKGSITQERVLQLIAQAAAKNQYGTESARIAAVEQKTNNCFTDPFNPNARFQTYNAPILPVLCPPLPPPPAPPAKACPLTKSQKMLYP
jgi:hypothetical protein